MLCSRQRRVSQCVTSSSRLRQSRTPWHALLECIPTFTPSPLEVGSQYFTPNALDRSPHILHYTALDAYTLLTGSRVAWHRATSRALSRTLHGGQKRQPSINISIPSSDLTVTAMPTTSFKRTNERTGDDQCNGYRCIGITPRPSPSPHGCSVPLTAGWCWVPKALGSNPTVSPPQGPIEWLHR